MEQVDTSEQESEFQEQSDPLTFLAERIKYLAEMIASQERLLSARPSV
jgi:hypothetical protein